MDYYGAEAKLEAVSNARWVVPLFQEQMLEMAMVMASFTGEEAEELRRAMSFHRSREPMWSRRNETTGRDGSG